MPTPYTRLKQLLFGRPLPSERLDHERLNKKTALAVLSSDAISSVAYATEQILLVLAVLSTAALGYVLPISAVIVGLLVLVALLSSNGLRLSSGGARTRLPRTTSAQCRLVAAAALLTDYILTVAVSISGGIAAITSAYASLAPHTVLLCTVSIVVLMLVNLRGCESPAWCSACRPTCSSR
jgi:amino acid transporter